MNSSGKREQSPGVVPDAKRQQPQEPVTDVPKARYTEKVTEKSMATFMRAMKECSSWEGVNTKLAWEPIPMMDHQLSIAVYLALNVGETLPDWVHDPEHNVIGELLKSEEDVIKALLAELIDFDDPESERGVLAHPSFAIALFVLHFEPNTLRQDRLCPQRFCFAHDGTEQSWNFEHRCQEVLVYAAGMVGHLYGLDLETSVKFIRSSTVFANIVPVDGDATWTSEAGSKPPEDYQKITKITDPIMESVFGRLPVLCPNLKGVFVFGEYANDARKTLLQGMDPPIISGPRHCHPQRHVCPFATEDEKRLLINSMSEWWAGILNISKPIKLEPRDLKIEMIFRKSRRTGTDAPGGTDAVYDAMYCFEYETRGSQEERLAEVDERHPGTRADLENILTGVTTKSFDRERVPYLRACENRGCNYDFIRCTHEHKKDPEYKKTHKYIQGLRKRLQAGKLKCGEGKVIKKLEDVFKIPIKDEDVQQRKKVVLGRDEETIRNTLSGSWPS